MAKCNYNCFNCKFEDCFMNEITTTEKAEISKRDREQFGGYGSIPHAKKSNRNHKVLVKH